MVSCALRDVCPALQNCVLCITGMCAVNYGIKTPVLCSVHYGRAEFQTCVPCITVNAHFIEYKIMFFIAFVHQLCYYFK